MTPYRIKFLIDKYYSGEISPDDYEALLSALKEVGELTPELDAEREILLAIESCEPIIPDDFEKKLTDAIEKKHRRSSNIIKIILSGAAAAVMLIFLTIGIPNSSNNAKHSIESSIAHREVRNAAISETARIKESVETTKTDTSEIEDKSVVTEISEEDLNNAAQIVDEALLDILSNIHMAQNEAIESIESIQISQTTDFKI